MKTGVGCLLATCLVWGLGGCSSGDPLTATPGANVVQRADRNDGISAAAENAGFRVLYSFQNGTDGAVPATSLVADSSGNLYGTATNDGGWIL